MNLQILGAAITTHPRYLVIAPMTHAAGYMIPAFVARSGTVVVLPEFEAGRVLQTIEAEKLPTYSCRRLPFTACWITPMRASTTTVPCRHSIGAAPTAPERYKGSGGQVRPLYH